MACSVCDGTCSSACQTGCGDCTGSCNALCMTCTSACNTNCTGCTGTCSSCAAGCSVCTGCQGCTSCTSCSGCSGCSSCTSCSSGCSACTGSCTGYCDNACTSTANVTAINSLGSNILAGNTVKMGDFKALRDAIHNEFVRRNKTVPNDAYSVEPSVGGKIYKEHIQKVFDDITAFDSSKVYTVNANNIIKVSDITDSIAYIKSLMNQNIRA